MELSSTSLATSGGPPKSGDPSIVVSICDIRNLLLHLLNLLGELRWGRCLMPYPVRISLLSALFAIAPSLEAASSRALSIYLPVRAEGFDPLHYEIVLNHLADRYRERLDGAECQALDTELARVRSHLNLIRPAGCPAVAVFADEGAGLLTLVRLPVTTEARLEVGPLLLAPIEHIFDQHPPALVVVADKEEARTFAAVLGEVLPLHHLTGEAVKPSRAGGSSASSNQRKADNTTRANLRRLVTVIEEDVRRGSFTRLFLAGPDEARSVLESLLPKRLARMVAGHLSASLDTSPGEILTRVREQIDALAD